MIYFALSDIHSYYNEMVESLKQAGFQKTNKNHCLIVCGDIFDRGPDALKVYRYLKSIPKSRRILIKGNHEELYLSLLDKKYPDGHDFGNGTVDTFCQVAGRYLYVDEPNDKVLTSDYLDIGGYGLTEEGYQETHSLWEDIRNTVIDSPVTKWLKSKEWINYFELDKFIFVHSFIPTKLKEGFELFESWPSYSVPEKCYEYMEGWRDKAKSINWSDARWGCPWSQYRRGFFQPEATNGKVLVCGHWHTEDFYNHLDNNYERSIIGKIYFSEHLIGLDGGVYTTANGYFHPQPVMKIDENLICYDKTGKELKVKEDD